MTTLFNYDPYNDDFDEDKNFMRILFRPGYAVQARELTQLQTILSNQIEKFGNHIFKSGSPIVGGKISLDNKANYLILQSQYNSIDIVPEDFLNKTIISFNSTKTTRAKCIAVDVTDPTTPVLVIKYLSGDVFAENDEIKIFGQNIFAQARSTSAVGRSYVASIQEGVYYFKGQFVKVIPQFLVLELFYRIGQNSTVVNAQPTFKIGIEFDDTIIDEIDDTSLLDPAQGAFNYQAPGADRYVINTRLSKRTLDSSDDSSFFEIIRLVNGLKTKEIDYPIYSEIEKSMARRTHDESGNYTVDPFILSLEEGDSANGRFDVILDPGKAYVGGYEFMTIAPTTIPLSRARSTNSVVDYDLPTNYTSYVVVNSVKGLLNISSFPSLDIHCVPSASINVSTDAAYNSTKIGTTYANMFKYNTATDRNNGNTHTFFMNVFGVNGSQITGNTSSGSTTQVIKIPPEFSRSGGANVYANMYFRITDAGGSSIPPVIITESDPINTTITLATTLPFAPDTSNTFSIESDFKVAESFVSRSGESILFSGNIDNESKDPNTGFAYITEPNRNSLVFDVPFSAVKEGTISDFDFFARKVYANKVSGGDNIISISREGTDTFAFAGTPGTLSDSVILNNIICFIQSNSASNSSLGITPNTVLSLANSNFTVTANTPTTINIDVGEQGVRADFIITTRVNNADNSSTGAIRGKQLIPLTTGADLHAKVPYELVPGGNTLAAANSSTKTLVTDGTVFNDIGATWFIGTNTLRDLRTPGKVVSLQVPDVYDIVRITDSRSLTSNVTTEMLTSSVHDITQNFEFDNGQRKTHYDHATIRLKRGSSSPKGRVLVQYRYLKHLTAPSPQINGLFTVDSYLKSGSNFTYDQISVFNNKEDSKLVPLRSAFDFRPTKVIGGSTLSGAVNPDPDFTGSVDYEYYLSRIDRVIVKPSKQFAVLEGKPAISPLPPIIGQEDMLLYTLNIPAYTESVKDVSAEFENNRRYTMRDIGNFDRRIKGLEYYVSLNALEKDTTSNKILDSNGLERSKYGILVDNFSTSDPQATYTDVGFDNRCLVEGNELKPASLMRTFKLKLDTASCTGDFNVVGQNDKQVLMLDYTTQQFANQPYATKTTPIAAALFANFYGTTKLYPEYVGDVDTNTTAKVVLNSFTGIENAFNFINDAFKYLADSSDAWSEDKNNPFSKIATSSWYTESSSSVNETALLSQNGFVENWGNIQTTTTNTFQTTNYDLQQRRLGVSSSQVDVGTFVTDISIQPYIVPRQIIFNSEGLRPSTTFFAFFDDAPVSTGATKGGTPAQYSCIVNPNKVNVTVSSGTFLGVEKALVANSTVELAADLSNYLSGGLNNKVVTITNKEPSSNVLSIVNESVIDSLNNKFIIGLDSLATGRITSILEHNSGLALSTSATTITLSPDAPSVDITGNTISLVTDTSVVEGYGETFTVTSYNTTTKVATVTGTPNSKVALGFWVYSIGRPKTNTFGQVSGAFWPRKSTFRSGERKFRVTESFNDTYDTDAISYAEKTYLSSGLKVDRTDLVNTVYNVGIGTSFVGTSSETGFTGSKISSSITSSWSIDNTPPPPPVPTPEPVVETPPPPPRDPLAQTFYVDPSLYPYGVFIDNINLFFRIKDDSNLPVMIQIRPTVNGTPHSDYWYPESVVTKYPSEIIVSENPSVTNLATATNFKFYNPVFLKPGLHAVVILTDSPDYTVWIAEKGKNTVDNQYVGVNPYIGTLYKSQNSMEYVPFINEDLMFTIDRCTFSTNQATFVLQSEGQSQKYYIDKFRVLETKLKTMSDASFNVNYSFISKPIGASKETVFREISPLVTYPMGNDDLYVVGDRRKELQDQGDFTLKITMSTVYNSITPLISLESLYLNAWENFLDNASVSASDFNIITDGSGYSNSNTITINSSTGSGAEIYMVVDGANGNVIGINVASGGSGYIDDYTISFSDTSTANITANAVIILNSEFDEAGGPADAKYITKPITLADGFDAGDLRVFLNINKPGNSDIHVFYKILSGSDTTQFKDRVYQKMECFNPLLTPSKTDSDFTELEFRPSLFNNFVTYQSDAGVTYDSFKTFAIKIVMTSTDPAVIPKVRDLRIIALPAE
jgi:hypothetical protein